MSFKFFNWLTLLICQSVAIGSLYGQFTNYYPKLPGVRQQIYIEGQDLPFYTVKPAFFSKSIDGSKYAYCQYGKIFFTNGQGNIVCIENSSFTDYRPIWNNAASKLVFVRDKGRTISIMQYDLLTARQSEVFSSSKMDIDPSFWDDETIMFSSSAKGSFDIYKKNLLDSSLVQLTNFDTFEMSPVRLRGDSIIYISKTQFGDDELILFDVKTRKKLSLKQKKFFGVCKLSVALEKYVIYSSHENNSYTLKYFSVEHPQFEVSIPIRNSSNFISPSFCELDTCIYFTEFLGDSIITRKIKLGSREIQAVDVSHLTENVDNLYFKVGLVGESGYVRVSISDSKGIFFAPSNSRRVWIDPNLGKRYTYSKSQFSLHIDSLKKLTIDYSYGLEHFSKTVEASPGDTIFLPLELKWDNTFKGNHFFSADNHFHLNVGGPYYSSIRDLGIVKSAENIQFLSPLVANIGERITDIEQQSNDTSIVIGQEVRSHFHGHLSLLGIKKLFFPQFWGPFYEVHNNWDLSNSSPINYAKSEGKVATYVHPTFMDEPYSDLSSKSNTYDIIQNAINEGPVGIELADIYSHEVGAQKIYESLLNVGSPVFLNAGTDAFFNFYRSPPIGSCRVYTYSPSDKCSYDGFLKLLKGGRSFATNGPILLFAVNDSLPGAVLTNTKYLQIEAKILSFETDSLDFQVISNSNVIYSRRVASSGKFTTINITIPSTTLGWILARVTSSTSSRIYSDSYPYAISSPVWLGESRGVDALVKQRTAKQLVEYLQKNRSTVLGAYNGIAPIQVLNINRAILKLESVAK